MNLFDNYLTREIDCQLIVAPQYGMTGKSPRNLHKKNLRKKCLLQPAEIDATPKVTKPT